MPHRNERTNDRARKRLHEHFAAPTRIDLERGFGVCNRGFRIITPFFREARGLSYRKLLWCVSEVRRWKQSVALYGHRQGKFLPPRKEVIRQSGWNMRSPRERAKQAREAASAKRAERRWKVRLRKLRRHGRNASKNLRRGAKV